MKLDVARLRALLDELERALEHGENVDGRVVEELSQLTAALASEMGTRSGRHRSERE